MSRRQRILLNLFLVWDDNFVSVLMHLLISLSEKRKIAIISYSLPVSFDKKRLE